MPGVVRLGDIGSGHNGFPPRPCIEASSNVFANGIAVHREGDAWDFHTKPDNPSHDGVLSSGSGTVFVNGKAIGRIGDPISCGSTADAGSGNVIAG